MNRFVPVSRAQADSVMDLFLESMRQILDEQGLVVARRSDELKQCPACSLWFAPARKDQVFCRAACRQRAFQMTAGATAAKRLLEMVRDPHDGTPTALDALTEAVRRLGSERDK